MKFTTNVLALLLTLVATPALADGWSDWEVLDDTREDQISVRLRKGSFKFENDAREWHYQFRSNYAETVKFDFEVSCQEEGGIAPSRGTHTLRPGAESSTVGAYTICQHVTVRVGRVRRAEGN